MKMVTLVAASLLLLAAPPAGAQEGQDKTTRLFADDTIIDLAIDGPVREIARKSEVSTDAYPATLATGGEILSVEVSARGISRRRKDKCSFPPLRIRFTTKPEETSLFHRQGSIKLVTHCNDNTRFEQYALREYAAYRLYNILTPESLKVRLARITYRDSGKVVTTRLGFLIEDGDDAARRLGMKEVDTGNIRVAALNREDGARYALFQYMIGNTDWAMDAGPDPADCCHNSRLFGAAKDARSNLTPVPYDFDNAGLVDAPYAMPHEKLRARDVKVRIYRGYCAFNDSLAAEIVRFRDARPAMEAELGRIPELDERTLGAMTRYLGGFFDGVARDASGAGKLAADCL